MPSLKTSLSAGLDLEASPGSRMEQQITPELSGTIYRRFTLGEVQYDYGVTFWQASPYAQAEISPVDRLRFDLGLRFDYVGFDYDNHLTVLQTGFHRRPGSTSVSYRRLSPKLGATLEVATGVHLFGSYRAAFRAPSESQLFRQGSAVSTVDLAPV